MYIYIYIYISELSTAVNDLKDCQAIMSRNHNVYDPAAKSLFSSKTYTRYIIPLTHQTQL